MNDETKITKQEEPNEAAKKPKKTGVIRGTLRSMFNVKRMISGEQIAATTKAVAKNAKAIFVPRKAEHNETFEQAIVRLNLTEADVEQRVKQFFYMAIFYGVCALALFIYGIYLIFNSRFLAIFACFSIMILMIVNALREHFWYMQSKKRKLGCTLTDWVNFILGKDGEKK